MYTTFATIVESSREERRRRRSVNKAKLPKVKALFVLGKCFV